MAAPGQSIDPAKLISFLRPRMADFMVPRSVRIFDELPKTLHAESTKARSARRRYHARHVERRKHAGVHNKRERISDSLTFLLVSLDKLPKRGAVLRELLLGTFA